MRKRVLQPGTVARPRTRYSQGIEVEGKRLVFVAGQVPTDADGQLVGAADVRAQTRRVFENIAAVLAEAGATFADVVEIMVFLRNIDDYRAFSDVRDEFLGSNPPASTLVAVSALVDPLWLVEARAVAVLD